MKYHAPSTQGSKKMLANTLIQGATLYAKQRTKKELFKKAAIIVAQTALTEVTKKAINYGPQKKTGGHDNRYNKGDDRNPAQKAADIAKRKN